MTDHNVGPVGTDSELTQALISMRADFRRGDYDQVLSTFEGLGPTSKIRSGIRVEAAALAARSHIVADRKPAALALLKKEWGREQTSARLCAYLAIACLELGDYQHAAELAAKAAALKPPAPPRKKKPADA